jgi:outer membrane protein OmpA-like peptidoglycan-associated protein
MRTYWILTFLFTCILLHPLTAKDPGDEVIVKLEGKILDAVTLEPLAAKVTFKILPGGNVTGIRMFANEQGEYFLELQKHRSYRLEVSAEDYQPEELVISTQGTTIIENDFLLNKIPTKGAVFPLSSKIFFERGEYSISNNSISTLQMLADIMTDHPKMVIRLEGHTDQGALKSLLRLSENRVREVRRYMVDVLGVEKKRIKVKAYGGSRPITTENTAEARQKNRRVEVRLLKL